MSEFCKKEFSSQEARPQLYEKVNLGFLWYKTN